MMFHPRPGGDRVEVGGEGKNIDSWGQTWSASPPAHPPSRNFRYAFKIRQISENAFSENWAYLAATHFKRLSEMHKREAQAHLRIICVT